MRELRRSPGFTLIEMIIVLAILAVVAGLIAPLAFRLVQGTQTTTTTGSLQNLNQAIIGDQKQTFGFFGDVGDYPCSLQDLVRLPTTLPSTSPPCQVTVSVPGWMGPYVNATPDPTKGNQLTDSFGSPFEYFLVNNTGNLPDRLAIISRGPDGTSTNTSSTPNNCTRVSTGTTPPGTTCAEFTGTSTPPTDNTYLSGSNADNLTFPGLDSANNDALLRVFVIGSFAPTIMNFDSNPVVNAFVPACPGLFKITQTSVPRGSADVRTDAFEPGMVMDLSQGFWNITITTPLATTPVFAQVITILPSATLTPAINFTGLDSRFTPTFTLTVINQFALISLEADASGTKLAPVTGKNPIPPLTTATFTVNGCAPVQILNTSTKQVVDQFTMPFAPLGNNFTRIEGTPPVTLTVIDNTVKPRVKVFDGGVQIGTVRRKRQKSFVVNTGDTITITDNAGNVLQTFTITAATTVTF